MIVFYAGTKKEWASALQMISNQLNQDFILIGDDSLEKTMQEILLGQEDRSEGSQDPFLFMDTMDLDLVKDVETRLQENNILIERKACLTEHNKNWRLSELLKEIDQEVRIFKLRDQLYSIISKPDPYLLDHDMVYRNTMVAAFDFWQDPKTNEEDLLMAFDAVKKITAKNRKIEGDTLE